MKQCAAPVQRSHLCSKEGSTVICLTFVSPFRVTFTLVNTASYLHLQKESSIVKAQGTAAARAERILSGETPREEPEREAFGLWWRRSRRRKGRLERLAVALEQQSLLVSCCEPEGGSDGPRNPLERSASRPCQPGPLLNPKAGAREWWRGDRGASWRPAWRTVSGAEAPGSQTRTN